MADVLCNKNFNQVEIQNAVIQNLAIAPATPVAGQIYFDTTLDAFQIRNTANTAWISVNSDPIVSADALNDITAGTDGGAFFTETHTDFDIATTLGSIIFENENGDVTTYTQSPLVLTTDGTALGVALSGTGNHTADITLLSADANNALTTGADGGLFFNPSDQSVVADITARDALVDLTSGDVAYVVDASADATVDAGAALYVYDGAAWQKIAEFESVDVYTSVVSAQPQAGALAGRTIATHDDGDAGTAVVNVEETITTATLSAVSGTVNDTLTLVSEDNTTTVHTFVRKVATTFTTVAGVASNIVHNLGTTDVDLTLYDAAGNVVDACISIVDANTVSVLTNDANANLKLIVVG